jgi:hypothetical protein
MPNMNDLIGNTMTGMGMPQGSQIPGAVQGIDQAPMQEPQGQKQITPEMEAKYQAALGGDAGAMANFIMMVVNK